MSSELLQMLVEAGFLESPIVIGICAVILRFTLLKSLKDIDARARRTEILALHADENFVHEHKDTITTLVDDYINQKKYNSWVKEWYECYKNKKKGASK